MSLESTLMSLLSPLVAGRVYIDTTPDSNGLPPVPPLILWQQVGGIAVDYAEGAVPDHEHARVQVMVWSLSPIEAAGIARAARAALIGSGNPVQTLGAPVSLFEQALKFHGRRIDFGIWYRP